MLLLVKELIEPEFKVDKVDVEDEMGTVTNLAIDGCCPEENCCASIFTVCVGGGGGGKARCGNAGSAA